MTALYGDDMQTRPRSPGKFPTERPTGYRITLADGTLRDIPKAEFQQFFNDSKNRQLRTKFFGRQGAFNLSVGTWLGKYLGNTLYKKFGMNKKGGLADGKNTRDGDARSRLSRTIDALRGRLPNPANMTAAQARFQEKFGKWAGRGAKAGTAYMVAVGACIGLKIPKMISGFVAGVQLLQLLPVYSEVVGGPSGKLMAGDMAPDDMSAIGDLLTAKDSSGKSALDSPALQATMGINAGRPAVNADYVPGYGFMTNPVNRGLIDAGEASDATCDVVLSPITMLSFMAVTITLKAIESGTGIGALVALASTAIDFAVSYGIIEAIKWGAEQLMPAAIEWAKNAKIGIIEPGEDLGTQIAYSAEATYAIAGASNGVPGQSVAGISETAQMRQEDENDQRNYDIATLSPFDTSSQYTFFGSIMHTMGMGALARGGYTPLSFISSIFSAPAAILSPNASAAGLENRCSYADEFLYDTLSPETTPAITAGGFPCLGLNSYQDAMDAEDARNTLINAGWLDASKGIPDGATITDLMEPSEDYPGAFNGNGIIKQGTPLYEQIASCGDIGSGDYLFSATACMAPATTSTEEAIDIEGANSCIVAGVNACTTRPNSQGETSPSGYQNKTGVSASDKQLLAASVFLLDFMALQTINGDNDEPQTGSNGATSGDFVLPLDFGTYNISSYFGPRDCSDGISTCNHLGLDFAAPAGTPVYAISSGTVVQSDRNNPSCATGTSSSINNYVRIQHSDGSVSGYMHMPVDQIMVNVGDSVTTGQQIGVVGSCGQSTGPHLHLTTQDELSGNNIDPLEFLRSRGWDAETGDRT
jgi:hypothetical protein